MRNCEKHKKLIGFANNLCFVQDCFKTCTNISWEGWSLKDRNTDTYYLMQKLPFFTEIIQNLCKFCYSWRKPSWIVHKHVFVTFVLSLWFHDLGNCVYGRYCKYLGIELLKTVDSSGFLPETGTLLISL